MMEHQKYFDKLRYCLQLESDAERARLAERRQRRGDKNAEKHGEALIDLAIEDYRTGLGGRYLLSLVKRNREMGLPWNRFRVGAPVLLSYDEAPEEDWLYGIVSARSARHVEIAVDEWPDGNKFRIDLSADEVTRSRQLSAMNHAQTGRARVAQMRDILLGDREPIVDEIKEIEFQAALNTSQQQSILTALACRDIAIIHGPPGTGKTTTVAELIFQAVKKGLKVFATAPSNTGVDNLLDRLTRYKLSMVRIGHPARVQEDLQRYTLDAIIERDPAQDVIRAMFKEADQLMRKASKFTRAKPAPGSRQDMRQEARRLRDDARTYERQLIATALDRADVLCATATFDPEVLGDRRFDLAVIDEACQSTESGCWPVITRAEKVVFAGDHCQLPPTVLSAEASREGFAVSMMERLVALYGEKVTRRLTTQYRMHEHIMQFSSDQFYDGSLIADASVMSHRLCDLPNVATSPYSEGAATFIDTAGASWDEEEEQDGESRLNSQEGQLVLQWVDQWLDQGLPPSDIAVIAPYAAQVRWIRDRCSSGVEVDTVDGFQGREKEAVIISLVRSNSIGEIGFLGDTRRMNVAMTRARRRLVVIGDSATLANHPFYADMIGYFERVGGYTTVWESY
ncbi:MAG: AAA domain-containing protein [Pirellula sp.]|jgi:superfamily I DNA and/or RNA helicase